MISVVGEKPTLFRPGHITLEDLERALGEEVEVSKAILEKLPEGAVVRSPGMKYKHYAPKADVRPMWMPMPTRTPAASALPARPKSSAGPAWSMAEKAMVPIRQSISSAACAHWMSRGTGWSMPAARKRTACPWQCTTAAVFAAHGVPLVDADQISREILLPGSPLLPVLAQRFGADILYADGSLNRRLLADRAFAAPEGKAALDSLVLPEIIRRVCRLKQAAREAGAPLFVIDGAVIVGTDAEKECDHLCVVTAPFATSVARIAARDGIAPEMAARRLNAQTPEEVLLARADLVLRNDADLASLEAAAAALCEQLQAEGARKGGADTSL